MEKSRIFQLITETSELKDKEYGIELKAGESGVYGSDDSDIIAHNVFVNEVYHLYILQGGRMYGNILNLIEEIIKRSKYHKKIDYLSYDDLMEKYPEPEYKHYAIYTLTDLDNMIFQGRDGLKEIERA